MDQKLSKIDDKLDKLLDKLHEIEIQLTRNTDSLEVHEKRSDINEQEIDLVQAEVVSLLEKFQTDIKPIKDHIKMVNFVIMKLIPAIAGIIVFLYGIKVLPF